jgi:hypothetical protein
VTSLLGGVFVGLSFLSSSGPHLGVIIGGLLWTAFFLWALGKEIARHWRDIGETDRRLQDTLQRATSM